MSAMKSGMLVQQGAKLNYSPAKKKIKMPNHGLSPTPASASNSERAASVGGRAERVGLG